MVDFWQGEEFKPVVNKKYNGMIVRTNSGRKIQFKDATDGVSNTLLFSEKFTPTGNYDGSGVPYGSKAVMFEGDDCGWADGWDYDTVRSTGLPPKEDSFFSGDKYNNASMWKEQISFGSAHVGQIQSVFADGSVHGISMEINSKIFNQLGDRRDAMVFTDRSAFGG